MDVVVYRVTEAHRAKLPAGVSFAVGDVQPGQDVFTVGYPMGWGPTMSFGHLGNTNTFLQTVDTRLIQTDVAACSGNSGGGLFNDQGDVVGIMHAIIQTERDDSTARCSRMAFAIPARLAERIVTAALEGKPLAFSKMGIHMIAVKDGTKWRMAVKDVTEPAKSAGIQKHDIIIAVEDTEIDDAAHLKNYLIETDHTGPEGCGESPPDRYESNVHRHAGRGIGVRGRKTEPSTVLRTVSSEVITPATLGTSRWPGQARCGGRRGC